MNGAVVWHKAKKLADQLAEIKIKPEDVKFVAISHMHADHSSNVDMPGDEDKAREHRQGWPSCY